MQEREYWRRVVGYEDYLEVSNLGRVRSRAGRYANGSYKPYRIRKLSVDKAGYKYTGLTIRGKKQKYLLVHRLVATAFIPNPNNFPEVNHIDLDRGNCKVSNLEWCSHLDNMHHASINRSKKYGGSNPIPISAITDEMASEVVQRKLTPLTPRSKSRDINKDRGKSKSRGTMGGLPKKKIVAIDKEGKETEYESVTACAKAIGGFRGNIAACIKGKRLHTYKGYTFRYA